MVVAYKEAIKNTKDKVATQCPRVDPSILDELLVPEEGGIMIATSKDVTALAIAL